jgi:hypothetical protein
MTKVYDELVESALRELADEAEQRRLWLASKGPEVSSFIECVERLWTDSGLGDELDRRHPVYTPEIDEHFRELSAVLHRIDGLRAPKKILRDPSLERARVMATGLLQELRQFGSDSGS